MIQATTIKGWDKNKWDRDKKRLEAIIADVEASREVPATQTTQTTNNDIVAVSIIIGIGLFAVGALWGCGVAMVLVGV